MTRKNSTSGAPTNGSPSGAEAPVGFDLSYLQDESPLSEKLVRWGGEAGIVSFDGMFPQGLGAASEPAGTAEDAAFLGGFDVLEEAYYGQTAQPLRFMCIPCALYGERLPTEKEIVRDLRGEARFNHASEDGDWADVVTTDMSKQGFFGSDKDKVGAYLAAADIALMEPHKVAHAALAAYMRGRQLFWVIFHGVKTEEFTCDVFCFLVGVSPASGNLVGLFMTQDCKNFCD